jgi:hypothetical protein
MRHTFGRFQRKKRKLLAPNSTPTSRKEGFASTRELELGHFRASSLLYSFTNYQALRVFLETKIACNIACSIYLQPRPDFQVVDSFRCNYLFPRDNLIVFTLIFRIVSSHNFRNRSKYGSN